MDKYQYEYHGYHFYDKDKLTLQKRYPSHKSSPNYYKRTGSSSGTGSGTPVDLPGDYSLTAGGYTCTLTFLTDGTYVFDHPVGSNDRSGTWTQSGGEVTMTYTVSGKPLEEIFVTTETGNVVTLTLKDESAPISYILSSFNLYATSIDLTRK
jgi:hypothetical protein